MGRLILVALACLVIGGIVGGYCGAHYSHAAVALRRTRETICPSVPANTPMRAFPRACQVADQGAEFRCRPVIMGHNRYYFWGHMYQRVD